MYFRDHFARLYWLSSDGILFRWRESRASGLSGFDGFWEQLGPSLINTGLQVGTQAFQASRASGQQQQQLGAAFDQLAGQVTQLFDQIQAKAVITQNDLETAAAAYQQLANVAQQYGTSYITEQWNSSAYKPAYEARLRQMIERNQQSSGQTPVGSGQFTAPASALLGNPLLLPAIGIAAAIFLFKR